MAVAVPAVGPSYVGRAAVVEEEVVVAAGPGRVSEDPEPTDAPGAADRPEQAEDLVFRWPLPSCAGSPEIEERGPCPPCEDLIDRLRAAGVDQVTSPQLQQPVAGPQRRIVWREALAKVACGDRGDAVMGMERLHQRGERIARRIQSPELVLATQDRRDRIRDTRNRFDLGLFDLARRSGHARCDVRTPETEAAFDLAVRSQDGHGDRDHVVVEPARDIPQLTEGLQVGCMA